MTRLVMVSDSGDRVELEAHQVELHATVDGRRLIYSEPDATSIEWRTTGQDPSKCRSIAAAPHGIAPIRGLHGVLP